MDYVLIFAALLAGQALLFSLALGKLHAWMKSQPDPLLVRYRVNQAMLILTCALLPGILLAQSVAPWDRTELDIAIIGGLVVMILLCLVNCAIAHARLQDRSHLRHLLAAYRSIIFTLLPRKPQRSE